MSVGPNIPEDLGEPRGTLGPTGRHQSLGLALLVRGGSTTAERCIESALPLIDYWTIAYSGKRPDKITRRIDKLLTDIPGELRLRAFRDIAYNRTALLHDAQGTADYLLVIDDDHTVEPAAPLPALGGDVYMLRERDHGQQWRMPRLLKGDREWRYSGGPAHEYLEHDIATRQPCDVLIVHHHGDGIPAATKLEAARASLEQQVAANPTDARAVFYLANTLRELGDWQAAAAMYRLRLTLPGWDEETFLAQYRLGCILTEHISIWDGAPELIAAHRMRPHRAEPMRALANAANAVADRLPVSDDLLFVELSAYNQQEER